MVKNITIFGAQTQCPLAMKTLKLLSFSFLFILSNNLKAAFYSGAEIIYSHIAGNSYEITLNFFRNCEGVQVGNTQQLSATNNTNSAWNFNFTVTRVSISDVSANCPTSLTNCTGGSLPGYQLHVYKAIVTLPASNKWTIKYESCCRGAFTTVPSAPSNGWAVYAEIINPNYQYQNTSPVFSNPPVSTICSSQPTCIDMSAFDEDGDSLVYSLIPPFAMNSTTINYGTNFSFINFLSSSTGVNINSSTGLISVTPSANLNTIAAVSVKEYRKINNVYMHIGTVMRDFETRVISCADQSPEISGMDLNFDGTNDFSTSLTNFELEVCANDSVKFAIYTRDLDALDPLPGNNKNVNLKWNQGIPGGSFNVYHNNTDTAFAIFRWLPENHDISSFKKCFTVTATDHSCNFNISDKRVFCLKVKGVNLNLGTDTTICNDNAIEIGSTPIHGSAINWFVDGNLAQLVDTTGFLTFDPSNYTIGNHQITATTAILMGNAFCLDTITKNVLNIYKPTIHNTFPDTFLCSASPLILDAGQGSIYSWQSSPSNTVFSTSKTTNFAATNCGSVILYVSGDSNNICHDADTFMVSPVTSQSFNIGNDTTIHANDTIHLHAGTYYPSYIWSTGHSTSNIQYSPASPGNEIIIATGYNTTCLYRDSLLLTILPGTGIDEISTKSQLKIFPNPNNGNFKILIEDEKFEKLSIYDIAGKMVFGTDLKNPKMGSLIEISTKDLNQGTYKLVISSRQKAYSEILIIRK